MPVDQLATLPVTGSLVESLSDGLRRLPGHPAALFGRGATSRLEQLLEAIGSRRCLVIRGQNSYGRCGAAAHVERAAQGRELLFVRAEPWRTTLEEVARTLEVLADFAPDTVLAVGGGSALDLAKAVANLEPADPAELAEAIGQNRVLARSRALVLIPTTAGSGSELTQFATLWNGPAKLSLDAPGLRADLALIDPDLVASAPVPVAVAAAADALCQAVESCWAVTANGESRALAGQAFRLLVPAIAAGCRCGSLADPALHEALMAGAALAGAAINLSRTTAAHALSYPLTARLDLPHGAAVALHLPWLVEHNRTATAADCRLPEGPGWLAGLVAGLQAQSLELAGMELAELSGRLLRLAGFPTSYAELHPSGQWREDLLELSESPRMRNNPRQVGRADLLALLAR
ncbi:MAG: iron-containing alcohol dehydrogenase [Actinomycetota bacterium]|nr:iron-containing alcohol dehydrogenase [Actinomycetota bacterium]MDQ2958253.1 iron-containing alcohol dehydrogenase [Actinomycetota bacterium]